MRFGGRFQGRFGGRFGGRFDGVGKAGAVANMVLQSRSLDLAPWTNAGATVTPDAIVAPDGTSTADMLTVTAAAGVGRYQLVAVEPSTQYTLCFNVQLGTLPLAAATFAVRNETAGAFIALDIPLDAATNAGGWTRTKYTFVTPAGCTSVRIYPIRTHSTLFAAGTAYYWGVLMVPGAAAVSYVNLALQSQSLDVSPWTNAGATVTPDAAVAPNNTLTADMLAVAAAGGQGRYQVISVAPGSQYTLAFDVQLGTLPLAAATFCLRNDTAGAFIAVDIPLDAATNAVGWTRSAYSFVTPAGCTLLRIYPLRTHGTLFAAGTAYYSGIQLEPGPEAPGHLPTTTVPVYLQ